jgi:hypothetical protein
MTQHRPRDNECDTPGEPFELPVDHHQPPSISQRLARETKPRDFEANQRKPQQDSPLAMTTHPSWHPSTTNESLQRFVGGFGRRRDKACGWPKQDMPFTPNGMPVRNDETTHGSWCPELTKHCHRRVDTSNSRIVPSRTSSPRQAVPVFTQNKSLSTPPKEMPNRTM